MVSSAVLAEGEALEQLKELAKRKNLNLNVLIKFWGVTDSTYQDKPAIAIPYDGGVTRYRTPEGMRVPAGTKMKGKLYAAGLAKEELPKLGVPLLWIVEGESDTWAMDAAGLCCVGIPGVTMWDSTGKYGAGLARLLKSLGGQAVWVCDDDAAGLKGVERLQEEPLGEWADLPFFYIPKLGDYKDVGEAWADLRLPAGEFREWLLDREILPVKQKERPTFQPKFLRNPLQDSSDALQAARDGFIRDYIARAASAPKGERNNTLRASCYEAARRLEGSSYTEASLRDAFLNAASSCGLPATEARTCVKGAVRDGLSDPYPQPERKLPTNIFPPTKTKKEAQPPSPEVTPEKDFWDEHPMLSEIWMWAIKRRMSPWALLGALLAHAPLCVSHQWRVPPLGEWAENLTSGATAIDAPHIGSYILLVAASSGGKSRAIGSAKGIMEFNYFETGDRAPKIGHPPSKQGLIKMFLAGQEKDEEGTPRDFYRQHALIQSGEGQELANFSKQEKAGGGWALRAALRDAWTGAELSSDGSIKERQHHLAASLYVLCCLIGVQYRNAPGVLGDKETGDSQRWLVLPANPTGISPTDYPPVLSHPRIKIHPDWKTNHGWSWLGVAPEVAAELEGWAACRNKEREPTPEEVESWQAFSHGGHTMLLRLKVSAALLIVLCKPPVVDAHSWGLAGELMKMSRQERVNIEDFEVRDREAQEEVAAGSRARREVMSSGLVGEAHDRALEEAVGKVAAHLTDAWVGKTKMRDWARCYVNLGAPTSEERAKRLDEVIERCEELGVAEVEGEGRRRKWKKP